jgi:hypothetical protein
VTYYKKGDDIEVTCQGRTADGKVLMASPNSQSLMISFDMICGGHVGKMPVTMTSEISGFSIIDGTEVTIRKKVTMQ